MTGPGRAGFKAEHIDHSLIRMSDVLVVFGQERASFGAEWGRSTWMKKQKGATGAS